MVSSFDLVKQFHRIFRHPVNDAPSAQMLNDPKQRELRLKLILTEAAELAQALRVNFTLAYNHEQMAELTGKALDAVTLRYIQAVDGVESDEVLAADALGDLDYVVNGAAIVFGFHLPSITREVHRSNMTKLDADGQPVETPDGKIVKGPNYEEPNIKGVLDFFRGPGSAVGQTAPEMTPEVQAAAADPAHAERILKDVAAARAASSSQPTSQSATGQTDPSTNSAASGSATEVDDGHDGSIA